MVSNFTKTKSYILSDSSSQAILLRFCFSKIEDFSTFNPLLSKFTNRISMNLRIWIRSFKESRFNICQTYYSIYTVTPRYR